MPAYTACCYSQFFAQHYLVRFDGVGSTRTPAPTARARSRQVLRHTIHAQPVSAQATSFKIV
eukprot:6799798-Pyramimonas_sp.AAC.1